MAWLSQGEKFDAHGDYVRRWCPELAKLPAKWIHRPERAPSTLLRAASVELGSNYPHPIVSHAVAREVALEKFARIRSRAQLAANGGSFANRQMHESSDG